MTSDDAVVLVVDDQPANLKLMDAVLSPRGFTVHTAATGEEALERLAETVPDLVLLDVVMPGIDGYETCRRLRQFLGSQVFIVALTGWGQEQDKDEALRAGFDAHLTKPADPAALEQLLEAAEPRATAPDHGSVIGRL
jgi:CheY-like chemotaxis protein